MVRMKLKNTFLTRIGIYIIKVKVFPGMVNQVFHISANISINIYV